MLGEAGVLSKVRLDIEKKTGVQEHTTSHYGDDVLTYMSIGQQQQSTTNFSFIALKTAGVSWTSVGPEG